MFMSSTTNNLISSNHQRCINSTIHYRSYKSSTYKPAVCNATLCSFAKSHACGDCIFKPQLQPGCNNNTCYIWGENPLINSYMDRAEIAEDILAIGSTPGVRITWQRFIFTCVESYLSRRLANGVTGIAGFGHESPLSIPNQLALDPTLNKKFGLCLSSSTRSRGVIFIGSGPYYVYNPKKINISKDLVYTKVITNRGFLLSEEYYIQVSSIRIAGQDVPLNRTLLSINKNNGVGGTKISSTIPFTILHTSIYDAVKIAFIKALPKNATLIEPPMKRFGVCFSSKNIRHTNIGPDVPVIDFVLHKPSAFWRIYGVNSVVQVKKDVMCLAFVGRDQTWEPSIVIGGYQLEENLLVFDLPRKKIGIAGFGHNSTISIPNQLASLDSKFTRKFGICLSSSTRSSGVIFIGSSPYYVYNPMIDISKNLIYTPLVGNPMDWLTPMEYHVNVSSIRIAGKDVPLNKTLLSINDQGHGGTRISTTIPFTILHTSIYEVVKTAFINALPKNVTMVDPPMKRFGACFSSKNIRITNVGPDVPVIDFVFHKKSAFWRIYGANSVVQVSKDIMCLAFVGRDQTWEPSIVIGGYQLEENLLVFDLPHKKIGFSSSLKLQQTSCSKYDRASKS
ncbi:hypothetical protein KY290_004543 [Solanum tuberosum]|uniref:Peptidase A1 domain-containing protein n=1 Tax=Solanum tuberosum TaxID=4113 RepID=A0ABQ7WW30_SOLTU|nr:hypothetical protein KY290_004543 [Solanum tuberosum]